MRRISIDNVEAGAKLSHPVYDDSGKVLLNRGVELTDSYINRLKDIGYRTIYISDPDLDDVSLDGIISENNRQDAIRHLFDCYKKLEKLSFSLDTKSTTSLLGGLGSREFKKTLTQSGIYHSSLRIVNDLVEDAVSCTSLNGFNSLKTISNYDFAHSVDVTVTSIIIGRAVQLNVRQMQELAMGSLFFNVGKMFLPKEILHKNQQLTEQEFAEMTRYPSIGYELLREYFPIMSTHVALQHREQQDGKGYPRGSKGLNTIKKTDSDNVIPLYAEITAIADVYDAMNSDRPFRKAMNHDMVVDYIRDNAVNKFNDEVVSKFLKITPRYPVGYTMEVVSGEYQGFRGVVIEVEEENLNLPNLRLLYDEAGNRISPINLSMRKSPDLNIKIVDH